MAGRPRTASFNPVWFLFAMALSAAIAIGMAIFAGLVSHLIMIWFTQGWDLVG